VQSKTLATCIVATAMSATSGAQAQQGAATSDRPKKLQRISQACDLCHRRSIRCRPSIENAQVQCQNCFDFGVACTYNRPSRRRRNPSVSHGQATPPNILPHHQRQSVVRINPILRLVPLADTLQSPSRPPRARLTADLGPQIDRTTLDQTTQVPLYQCERAA
jgi:Ni/Co efflux regulator RcnB